MASINIEIKLCSTCLREIVIDKSGIVCVACGRWFHARNACIESPRTCQQTEIETCHLCITDALPFSSISMNLILILLLEIFPDFPARGIWID